MRLFLLGCIALFVLIIITAAVRARVANSQATRLRRKERGGRRSTHSTTEKSLDQLFEENSLSAATKEALLRPETSLSELAPAPETESFPEADRSDVEAPIVVQACKFDYVVINVMAEKNNVFAGYELLQALLANGLRFGKSNLFHRHENKAGQGKVLFSLASVNQPGTFDMLNMGGFSCPGLAMFFVLKDVADPLRAYDAMLSTAQALVDDLGGELWNERLQPLEMDEVNRTREEIKRAYGRIKVSDDLLVES